jgi:hypothetical protein
VIYALVQNGFVINLIVYDGVSPYDPTQGVPVPIPGGSAADIGWTFDGTNFAAPAE